MPKATGSACPRRSRSFRSASGRSAAPYLCGKGTDEHERRGERQRGNEVSPRGLGGQGGCPPRADRGILQGPGVKRLGSKASGREVGGGAAHLIKHDRAWT